MCNFFVAYFTSKNTFFLIPPTSFVTIKFSIHLHISEKAVPLSSERTPQNNPASGIGAPSVPPLRLSNKSYEALPTGDAGVSPAVSLEQTV